MKLLVLLILSAVVACAAPPMPGTVGQIIDATIAQSQCPKCDNKPSRLDAITFTPGSNPHGTFVLLQFEFKCPRCGEKFRKREVIKP